MKLASGSAIRSRRAAYRQRHIGSIGLAQWSTRTAQLVPPIARQSLDDVARELRIHALGDLMCAAKTRAFRVRCWQLMRAEIMARADSQIKRMEREQGLM
ncbi:hypothetical protein [Caballeronia sp. dw_19]|uniref:hypothetical protein n=1 Tax=Caballeronia sp. dw_19 TaxID=2719791 RepID=UPI001BD546AC|nr:hypothetical protein [Caballeronia sp. dw_19]